MSDERLPIVALPYVEDGECEHCDRQTPQLYAWFHERHMSPYTVCGWCAWKARWITDHASALAPSFLAPDDEEHTP